MRKIRKLLKDGLLLGTAVGAIALGADRINTRAQDVDPIESYVSCELEQSALPGEPYLQGKVLMRTPGLEESAVRDIVERENPYIERFYFEGDEEYGPMAKVNMHEGLEFYYRRILRGNPDVEGVDLNYSTSGQGYAPGSLIVTFKQGVDNDMARKIIRDLKPELSTYDEESTLAIVDVPETFTIDFPYWYDAYEEVECVDLLKPDENT